MEIKSTQESLHFGRMKVSFFEISHSIMDAIGIIIQTPIINVIHAGDWKYDLDPVKGPKTDYSHLARWDTSEIPSVLMMEGLGSTKEGHQLSEREINKNIKNIIAQAPGRVIIATFSSMFDRVGQIIDIAEELGKKVVLDGYSMKINIQIAKEIGYLKFKPSVLIDIKNINEYPPQKIIVIATGAQGEDRAVMMRIANGKHRSIKITKSDTILFSSSIIPGNERTVQRLKDSLYRQGADVIHKETFDVHGGGHALIEDIKLLIKQVKPHYLLPVYANHFILKEAAKLALSIGISKTNIFILDNGSVLEFSNQSGPKLYAKKVPTNYVFVDGLGVGDVGEVVLKDRQTLSEDGMFVVIAIVDRKTGKIQGSPDIISRGFVYLRESKDLLKATRRRVIDIIDKTAGTGGAVNWIYVKEEIRNKVGDFLYQQTERRPMVLPVVIEV